MTPVEIMMPRTRFRKLVKILGRDGFSFRPDFHPTITQVDLTVSRNALPPVPLFSLPDPKEKDIRRLGGIMNDALEKHKNYLVDPSSEGMGTYYGYLYDEFFCSLNVKDRAVGNRAAFVSAMVDWHRQQSFSHDVGLVYDAGIDCLCSSDSSSRLHTQDPNESEITSLQPNKPS